MRGWRQRWCAVPADPPGESPTVRRIRTTALTTALVAASLMLAGLADVRPTQAQASSTTVDIKDLAFSPATIQISQGDTVTWTNDEDVMPHDVTSGTVGAPDLGQVFGSELLMPG